MESAILSRVAVIRHHDSDRLSASATAGRDHKKQLHKRVVNGSAGRLHDVTVFLVDVFGIEAHAGLSISEGLHGAGRKRTAQSFSDFLKQLRVRGTAENRKIVTNDRLTITRPRVRILSVLL